MKKTYSEIFDFINMANGYVEQQKGKENKLTYAIAKMGKQRLKPLLEEYTEKENDIKTEHASTDKDGNLIINGNQFTYKPDRLKAMNRALRELKSQDVEFEPYICTEVPELNESQKLFFEGFVL